MRRLRWSAWRGRGGDPSGKLPDSLEGPGVTPRAWRRVDACPDGCRPGCRPCCPEPVRRRDGLGRRRKGVCGVVAATADTRVQALGRWSERVCVPRGGARSSGPVARPSTQTAGRGRAVLAGPNEGLRGPETGGSVPSRLPGRHRSCSPVIGRVSGPTGVTATIATSGSCDGIPSGARPPGRDHVMRPSPCRLMSARACAAECSNAQIASTSK